MPSYDVVHIANLARAKVPLCGTTRVITIDGPAGSGKTTLAAALAQELGECAVVHMDDLYEGWSQDLNQDLAERIQNWILTPLELGHDAQHLKYDWIVNAFNEIVAVPRTPFLILEGVGSGNSKLRHYVTLAMWIESDSQLLVERVVERDGEQLRDKIIRWQELESQFHALHKVKDSAHLQLRGDG